jgi:hypothetical protein
MWKDHDKSWCSSKKIPVDEENPTEASWGTPAALKSTGVCTL